MSSVPHKTNENKASDGGLDSVEMVETVEQGPKPVENPWAIIRSHPKLVCYAVIANVGPLMFGYDLVVVGAISALPAFRRDFGEAVGPGAMVLPALWLGLWNGFVQAGTAAGSFFAGWFQDRFGRRSAFALGGIFGLIGTTVSYTSSMVVEMEARRGVFLLAKMLIGFGCGILMSACQTYISETAPRNLRGVLLGFYAFNVSFGHLLAMAVVFDQIHNMSWDAYRIPFATQWAFGAIAVIAALILPESPVWLVSKKSADKAMKSLERLGTNKDHSMLERIQVTLAAENTDPSHHEGAPTFSECFKGTNLRRTLVIIWLNILQQFVGISLVSNGAYFLIMAGMSAQYSLMVNLIGIASNMVANMISWYTVPRFGRRTMILFSIILDIGAWLAMGVAGCFSTTAAQWFVGVSLLLFGFFNSFGVSSAVPVITSEISCVRLRSKSAGIGLGAQSVAFWIFSFFTPYLYNTDEANWGGKIGFFFAGLSAFAYVVTWWVVPETKGRNFIDLDFLFAEKVKARAFSKTAVPQPDAADYSQKPSMKEDF
ncbi:hypothetical protein FZEAL_6710 [Fusarium zealandicum]|uniref:Major facilitator superfamily (MFS) profile domain-containing protein n=1 Tax=Fusarium zealandicum TaxID=1053134 RepID=A0A8H4XJL5_9HYPO|nr:hypothetical protein FZEAL_6710 [Fusarium zealandicum]